jgi:hypothetical protein
MIPDNILRAQQNLYSSCNLLHENLIFEKESKEYQACNFTLHNYGIKFRQAKITPIKIGQFVTCWKRSQSQDSIPFDASDNFDFLIIGVHYNELAGQFIFPKSVLIKQKIISTDNIGGKRGIRVYPAWDKPNNKQAIKTQLWQLPFFFDITSKNIHPLHIKNLFNL